MKNDDNTIIDYNYVAGIAGALTKRSCADVTTTNIEKFIAAIEERHGIKAFIQRKLAEDRYFIIDRYYIDPAKR
jgi:hypothetical protein